MRRPVRLLFSLALSVTTLASLTGLAATAAVAQADGAVTSAAEPQALRGAVPGGVDDFAFASMHADYTLGLDADGHSTLATTETLVARFPESDQNRGIRRVIPTHYRGQPTGLTIDSVTDETGAALEYETDDDDDDTGAEYISITIADEDYVHGEQTYVIGYHQKHVTLFPEDSATEEFYWEVNGTGWAQPFDEVSATLRVAPELVPKLTDQAACYQGGADSGATCDGLRSAADGDAWVLEVTAADLGPHEGLTLVAGFAEGTFVPRDDSFTANPFPTLAALAALAALVAAMAAAILRGTRWGNRPGRPTIIAEYLPPAGVNVLQAGNVLGYRASSKALTAQLLQFAVRGNVRVVEGDGKNHYLLELRSRAGLDRTETAVLTAFFPAQDAIGTLHDLKAKHPALGPALQQVQKDVRASMLTQGLRQKKGGALRRWLLAAALVAGVLAVVFCAIAFATEVAGAWPALFLVVGLFALIVTLVVLAEVRPLTAAGAELRDYLKGVTVYISLAEADRLRVLQSPQGALRTPYRPAADTTPGATEPGQVLKLYERLLPIAVLTGQEKQWSSVLGDYYADTREQPDWYAGTAPFNAAYFATGVAAFAGSTATAISASAGSSSSSGASGGSVGGGGGGGGGGGV
jgi:uncharacterized membrane protein YgcG